MSPVRDILSRQGREALQSLRGHRVLFAFDFDGTLAPLASHPKLVRVSKTVRSQLSTLAGLASVAVVSGRSLADLQRFFPRFRGSLIGNHGAEGLPEYRDVLPAARQACRIWRHGLLHLLRACQPQDGVWLEDKKYSFTVHSPSPSALRAFSRYFTREVLRSLPPMRFLPGKASVNILPFPLPDKGQAIDLLLRRMRAERGVFVGDDETDEDVFSVGRKRMITVRVGRLSRTHAAFYLRSQKEIGRLLTEIVGVCRSF